MLENFELIKKKLSELAGVINAFKSEAVQLRLIELLLGDTAKAEEEPTDAKTPKRKKGELLSKVVDGA